MNLSHAYTRIVPRVRARYVTQRLAENETQTRWFSDKLKSPVVWPCEECTTSALSSLVCSLFASDRPTAFTSTCHRLRAAFSAILHILLFYFCLTFLNTWLCFREIELHHKFAVQLFWVVYIEFGKFYHCAQIFLIFVAWKKKPGATWKCLTFSHEQNNIYSDDRWLQRFVCFSPRGVQIFARGFPEIR